MANQLYSLLVILMVVFGELHGQKLEKRLLMGLMGKGHSCSVETKKGDCCVFPFLYNGKWYDSCATNGNSTEIWCATTMNYDKDKKWGTCKTTLETNCPVLTTTGSCCVFPFLYQKEWYQTCTKVNHGNKLWCATTMNYDKDKEWGTCQTTREAICPVKTISGTCCVFPFLYQKKWYRSCTAVNNTGKLWCATTMNYDADKKGEECQIIQETNCPVITKKGGCCVFPFLYQNKPYQSCITLKNGGKLWCATTMNYDKDKKWGNCQTTKGHSCSVETKKGECCVFPFLYQSKWHYSCPKVKNSSKLWCATTHNYEEDKKWGLCQTTSMTSCPVITETGGCCDFPFRYKDKWYKSCTRANSWGKKLWCSITTNYDKDKEWGKCQTTKATKCPVKTTKGGCCVFPFLYQKKWYHSCTKDNSLRLWCSTTMNYDADNSWGACETSQETSCPVITKGGDCCVFPFIYKGKPYHSCTGAKLWCATTRNYDKDWKWGYCRTT